MKARAVPYSTEDNVSSPHYKDILHSHKPSPYSVALVSTDSPFSSQFDGRKRNFSPLSFKHSSFSGTDVTGQTLQSRGGAKQLRFLFSDWRLQGNPNKAGILLLWASWVYWLWIFNINIGYIHVWVNGQLAKSSQEISDKLKLCEWCFKKYEHHLLFDISPTNHTLLSHSCSIAPNDSVRPFGQWQFPALLKRETLKN